MSLLRNYFSKNGRCVIMVHRKIVDFATEHKQALIFAAGIATAVVGKKILESDAVKEATTNAVAGVMSVKKDAEEKVEDIRKDAEALLPFVSKQTAPLRDPEGTPKEPSTRESFAEWAKTL
jgi:hypothetical protein